MSRDVIEQIPSKYNIGKRPLSLLLGWGELTYSRYCDGDMPTKQYSQILQQIFENPYYYYKILETNKENLTELAYRKTKEAISNILKTAEPKKSKIDHIADYLIHKCEDITQLSLQKALYYAQGFHHAFHGSFIFNEECEAWVHGPVYKKIYNRYRDYRFDPIAKKEQEVDFSTLSQTEIELLDSIITNICCYSGKTLELFTHSETPWLNSRGDLAPDAISHKKIDKTEIAAHFNTIKNKYQMQTPSDIKLYTQELFKNR